MSDLAGRVVLHVDDEMRVRSFVSKVLEAEGVEVLEAHDGYEALGVLRERQVDLVITDLGMPGMDGHRLLDRLAELHDKIPVIVLAAASTSSDVLAALANRVRAFLGKPATEFALLGAVRETLSRGVDPSGIEVISATRTWLEVRFPNHPSYISRVREFLETLEFGLQARERNTLFYVLTELAQNAIEHGNRLDPTKRATVAWYRLPGLRVFRVADEGIGFDPTAIPHAVGFRADANPVDVLRMRIAKGMRPGGLGIAAATRMADELIYSERANEVVLLKFVTDQSP